MHRERITAMIDDKGTTWDLSPNDVEALKWANEVILTAKFAAHQLDTMGGHKTQNPGAAYRALRGILSKDED